MSYPELRVMSPLLPMKETSREVVVEVTRSLQPYFPEITAAWRQADVLRIQLRWPRHGGAGAADHRHRIFHLLANRLRSRSTRNLQYFGERLAKLKVSARAVARSLEIYQQLIDPYLGKLSRRLACPKLAAMETLSWASLRCCFGAHFDAQKIESEALLAGAGRGAFGREPRCPAARVLEISTYMFGATLASS